MPTISNNSQYQSGNFFITVLPHQISFAAAKGTMDFNSGYQESFIWHAGELTLENHFCVYSDFTLIQGSCLPHSLSYETQGLYNVAYVEMSRLRIKYGYEGDQYYLAFYSDLNLGDQFSQSYQTQRSDVSHVVTLTAQPTQVTNELC